MLTLPMKLRYKTTEWETISEFLIRSRYLPFYSRPLEIVADHVCGVITGGHIVMPLNCQDTFDFRMVFVVK